MAKFKEVMTTENLSDYLDQHARIDVHNGLVYFGCSHCKQEALKKLERILCKKDFEKVKNLDLEFGTLIFNPETHDIMCSSRPNSNYDDTHAIELEAEMVKHYSDYKEFGEYLEARLEDELEKSEGGNNELLQ